MPDVRTPARGAVDTIMASPPVASLGRRRTRRSLRILAYHGVSDVASFRAQMHELVMHYRPVTSDDVVAAVREGRRLPDHAVWVTFDDGDPSILHAAMPVLDTLGIRPTVFVCPGLVDTNDPFWWDIVAAALDVGEIRIDGRSVDASRLLDIKGLLKRLPDTRRRTIVAKLAGDLDRRSLLPRRPQLTAGDLERLRTMGATIGNHSWDHPCLDMCSPEEQRRQIVEAHEWLARRVGPEPLLFAYPNGNHSEQSEAVLNELGYDLALLFDHHLTDIAGDPLRLSRLRVNDTTTVQRFAAILAGIHPAVHTLRRRLRRR